MSNVLLTGCLTYIMFEKATKYNKLLPTDAVNKYS